LRLCGAFGAKEADALTGSDLNDFLTTLNSKDWRHKHEVSVRAMFRWGSKHGHLPKGHSPFATVEPIRPSAKLLLESDLPTQEEVQALIANATPTLASILIVQHATGARSGELLNARVGDFQPKAGQIVLRHHKREKTMREPRPRILTLNANASRIIQGLCEGRNQEERLFLTPTNKPWTDKLLSHHFIKARAKASVGDNITPYSLRHLWISEALMAGLDAMIVARMAGTSIAMIERVYGRFRTQSLNEAQAKLDAMRACSISINP
jgi:integrase